VFVCVSNKGYKSKTDTLAELPITGAYANHLTLILLLSGAQIRLAGSNQASEGRLEVYYNGVWGTVCSDFFDDTDASVACFQLGLG